MLEVDFEDVGAVFGKGVDNVVAELSAFIQFELEAWLVNVYLVHVPCSTADV